MFLGERLVLWVVVSGPRGKPGGDAVNHHRHQRNHHARQQAFAKLRFADLAQHFPADIRSAADDRRDDHHTERGHCRLIDPQKDLFQR